MSRRSEILDAVCDALRSMGATVRGVENGGRHPRVLWEDGDLHGHVVVSANGGSHRAIHNNVSTARRLLRRAREERGRWQES